MTFAIPRTLTAFFRSRPFSAVLSTAGILVVCLNFLTVKLTGWPGYIGALGVLVALMVLVIIARRDEIEGIVVPPLSMLFFLGWATLSILWSSYQWVTLSGLLYLYGVTAVGLFIAFTRDTIQIVRAFGDALRWVLALSLGLELLSGLIIDTPIPYLAVAGKLAELGPISGVMHTRNQLGIVAVIAAISFATEWRTRSVTRLTSILSLSAAALCIVLTRSPIVLGTAAIVAVAAAVLYAVRRIRPDKRQRWQFILLGLVIAGVSIGWLVRDALLTATNATGQLNYRLSVWQTTLDLATEKFVMGWGWTGRWHANVPPFTGITTSADNPPMSGLNSYIDVVFQLGLVGLVIFVGMVGLAFVRSWLLAGRRRSIMYAWPALALVALILLSLAESSLLVELGWLIFVVCSVKASQELSWRTAFSRVEAPHLPHTPTAGA